MRLAHQLLISAVVFPYFFWPVRIKLIAAPASSSRLFLMAAWLGMFRRFFEMFKNKKKNYLGDDGKNKDQYYMCARLDIIRFYIFLRGGGGVILK